MRSVQGVNLKRVPELVVLQGPDESASSLAHCPPEALLLRWAAYHLAQPAARSLAGHEVCIVVCNACLTLLPRKALTSRSCSLLLNP